MARLLPLLLCLLMTPVLAGCSDDPGRPAPSEDSDRDGQGAEPAQPLEPSGETKAAEVATSTEPRTAVCSGTVDAAVGIQGNFQIGLYCPFKEAARGDLSGYETAVVEVRWPEAVATQTRFNLFLLSDSCNFASPGGPCNLHLEGSPAPSFTYTLPRDLLRADGDDGLRVYASFDGAGVQQPVDVAVTLVPPGGVLPDGHSAFPA